MRTVAYERDEWLTSLLEAHGYVRGAYLNPYLSQPLEIQVVLQSFIRLRILSSWESLPRIGLMTCIAIQPQVQPYRWLPLGTRL